ncbi:MAG TPA: RNA polymerase sigma factor [Steroidobacteraceae bacterium]|nr:RNA polymerase sigma factor [Steroidobacteraceae bacterium]
MTVDLPRSALAAAEEVTVVVYAVSGNDVAFSELVRRRQAWLRQLLRRLCRQSALADDLAQQTLLQAWRRLRTLKAPGAFGGWLRRLAINEWLQYARRVRWELALDEESVPGEEGIVSAVGEQLDLERALALLPAGVRLCIVLAYGEHMSHSEISAATRLPLGTVKSHIARGSARLRQLLHDYEGTGRE